MGVPVYQPTGNVCNGDYMTWVRLDDSFFRHPKAVEAGKDGRSLFLAGLCYCGQQLTDGWISQKVLPQVASDAGVKLSVARVLESVRLWDEGLGGFWVHDYLDYNPSAKDVKEARAKRAAAGAKGGSVRAANLAQRLADAQANAWANGQARA